MKFGNMATATRGFLGPGWYNDRMLIQIGHRLNENVYDGAYVDTEFPLDLDLIDAFNEIRCSRGKKLSLDRSVSRAYYFALGLDQ